MKYGKSSQRNNNRFRPSHRFFPLQPYVYQNHKDDKKILFFSFQALFVQIFCGLERFAADMLCVEADEQYRIIYLHNIRLTRRSVQANNHISILNVHRKKLRTDWNWGTTLEQSCSYNNNTTSYKTNRTK